MLGGLGIFDEEFAEALEEESKKKEKSSKTVKSKAKAPAPVIYTTPLKVVFDSIPSIEIKGDKTLTSKEFMAEVAQATGQSIFSEKEDNFLIKKVEDSVYLVRPNLGTRVSKGDNGERVLLKNIISLADFLENEEEKEEEEEVTGAEKVVNEINKRYGLQTQLYLVGDIYIPVPVVEKKGSLENLHFPVTITALTLFGESIELQEEDFRALSNQAYELTCDETHLKTAVQTLLPDYTDVVLTYNEEENILIVTHETIVAGPVASKEKEEMYPTDATISLVFKKIELSKDLFKGKEQVTRKEVIKFLEKTYPEFSLERTELRYDKKNKLIMPILKSGKRGAYLLIDGEESRREESPFLTVTAQKEEEDEFGCVSGSAEMKLPKIPFHILKEILTFFRDVYETLGTEAFAQIYYNWETGEYEVSVPRQVASPDAVEYKLDEDEQLKQLEGKYMLIMEIHSHGSFSAFWSRTDNEEELAHRLYAVVGNLPRFSYAKARTHILVRAATGGYRVQMDVADVFEFPKSYAEVHKDLEKIEVTK